MPKPTSPREERSALFTFSARYRVRVRRDKCNDYIIPGKYGHLYFHDSSSFGLVFESLGGSTRSFNARLRKALRTGLQKHQLGDSEGIVLFDRNNDQQALLAIALAGVRRRKVPSPNQIAALRNALAARRLRGAGATISPSGHQQVNERAPSLESASVSSCTSEASGAESPGSTPGPRFQLKPSL